MSLHATTRPRPSPWPALVALLCLASTRCGPGGLAHQGSAPGPETLEPDPTGGPRRSAGPRGALARADREVLEAHDRVRAEHSAPPLEWSAELAATARAWADELRASGCAFAHSPAGRYGENLFFAAPSSPDSGRRAVESWASEREAYSFARPGFSMRTGHFTQVVWRATRELGCGTVQCNGGDLWVCNYSPAGNVEGEYRDNVAPRSCGR